MHSRKPSTLSRHNSISASRSSEIIHEHVETVDFSNSLPIRSSFSSSSTSSRKLHRRGSSFSSQINSGNDDGFDFKCAGADEFVEAEWWSDKEESRRSSSSSNHSSSSIEDRSYALPPISSRPSHSRRTSSSPITNFHYPSASIASISSFTSTSSKSSNNSDSDNRLIQNLTNSSPVQSPSFYSSYSSYSSRPSLSSSDSSSDLPNEQPSSIGFPFPSSNYSGYSPIQEHKRNKKGRSWIMGGK